MKEEADLTVTIKEADFLTLAAGKLTPQSAFMKGLVKVKGKMALAMKLGKVLAVARPPRSKL